MGRITLIDRRLVLHDRDSRRGTVVLTLSCPISIGAAGYPAEPSTSLLDAIAFCRRFDLALAGTGSE